MIQLAYSRRVPPRYDGGACYICEMFSSSTRGGICLLVIAGGLRGAEVAVERKDHSIDIRIAGQPFTTYFIGPETAKPYLMPLRAADGTIVTRGFPIGNDVGTANPRTPAFEPHQRPLYFGHGDVDGLDFWQEEVFAKYYRDHGRQDYGRMRLERIERAEGGPESGSVRATFVLLAPGDRVIGEETQTYTFRGDDQRRLIDCEFTVKATHGPLVFGDTKEGTFGIRLAPELSGRDVRMTSSTGAQGERELWGKPADWVDYSGTINGKPMGVAIFDHPSSFRHPTTWHARAYGLFAANPFGRREFTRDPAQDGSWTVPEGKLIVFRYRVLIHPGDAREAGLADAYKKYAASAVE
jgi:hypothetical protein